MIEINEDTIVYPLPTDKLILEIEKYLKVELPLEFKLFIKKYNGAEPITNEFKVDDHKYVIEHFLCMLEDSESDEENGWNDIEVVITQIGDRLTNDENLIGMNIIPIGALFAGDYLCLDCRDETKNNIIIWDHEESEEFSPVFIKVADTFKQFTNILYK